MHDGRPTMAPCDGCRAVDMTSPPVSVLGQRAVSGTGKNLPSRSRLPNKRRTQGNTGPPLLSGRWRHPLARFCHKARHKSRFDPGRVGQAVRITHPTKATCALVKTPLVPSGAGPPPPPPASPHHSLHIPFSCHCHPGPASQITRLTSRALQTKLVFLFREKPKRQAA